jgi:hypothetical protein
MEFIYSLVVDEIRLLKVIFVFLACTRS